MKKLLFSVFVILSFAFAYAGGGDDDVGNIPVHDDYHWTEETEYQIPVFHAHINTDRTILVSVDRPTTFQVRILDASGNNVHYDGFTVDGVYHIITRNFASGHYMLVIASGGNTYHGEFEI